MPRSSRRSQCDGLLPLIPPSAYRAVTVREQPYWCFSLVVRVPGLAKVRLVISFQFADLSGSSVVLVTNQREWVPLGSSRR